MKLTALTPSAAIKLASIVVHAEEGLSTGGHELDLATIRSLLTDPEVRSVLDDPANRALLPLKRQPHELLQKARRKK